MQDISLNILAHAGAALVAACLGATVIAARKGTPLHKLLGWLWVACLVIVSVTAAFIQTLNPGGFSLLHLLIPVTLGALALAIWSIRRFKRTGLNGYRHTHASAMICVFAGGLLIAGSLALLPGRSMHTLIFG